MWLARVTRGRRAAGIVGRRVARIVLLRLTARILLLAMGRRTSRIMRRRRILARRTTRGRKRGRRALLTGIAWRGKRLLEPRVGLLVPRVSRVGLETRIAARVAWGVGTTVR